MPIQLAIIDCSGTVIAHLIACLTIYHSEVYHSPNNERWGF